MKSWAVLGVGRVSKFSGLVLLGCFGITATGQSPPAGRASHHRFEPVRLLPPQPAIERPPKLPAEKVENEVIDNELVIGVEIDGQACAYPINMLTGPTREIINDALGGRDIAVMWCHLCHSAVVFDRQVRGQTLTFVVSGMLWKRALVMKDLETGSLWSLVPGHAVSGPLAGTPLEISPSQMTTWKRWREQHPHTTVLDISRTSRSFVNDYYEAPDQFVYGIVRKGQAFHISMGALGEDSVQNLEIVGAPLVVAFDREATSLRVFSRRVGDQLLTFEESRSGKMTDRETGSVWHAASGKALTGPFTGSTLRPVVGMLAYARSWSAFYPQSVELP